MRMQKFGNLLNNLLSRLRRWGLDLILAETGVDVSPEPNVWGVLSAVEEENVLARLWNDKEFVALMRKYAEGANKALIARPSADREFWQYQAKFFCYNGIIL